MSRPFGTEIEPSNASLAQLALEVAREAAELVRGRRAAGVTVAATKSSEVDIVTEADRASERLIRRLIAARRPDDGFVGEEGDDVVARNGIRWIVDPIDGTVNFLYDLPQYAVSIAAEREGEIVAGVVLNVASGVEYVGHLADLLERGGAAARATRDGTPLAVRAPTPLHLRLVGTGFNYDARIRGLQAAALVRLITRVRDIRRFGSCALDLCHLAEGSLDGYVEEGVNLWDHAAGGLIAQIAGARLEHLPGVGGSDLVVCAPTHGFDELVAAVQESGFTADEGVRSGE
ncbi:inositol monophosphatase family protein [Nocardioides sp. T2.26MG-1]|uniref:inositol monophosphatase family protein n=1 Tax=Nocardioides sp. T2.26MG-1 TaxID=3041166 RepID=UPI0024773535|nr:inositol monophosphatase family protein [Nocardioides sp. T2.26MG-1]CAI9413107.1 Inositol-1-monophosphatase SuhB [Nocardioides sp. T2.26MG-1]